MRTRHIGGALDYARLAESLSAHEVERRIKELHAAGYKPRDISSLTGVHPQIVLRVINAKA